MHQTSTTKTKKILIGLVILLVLIGSVIAVVLFLKSREKEASGGTEVVDWDAEIEDEDQGGSEEGILIPGYDTVVMNAGQNILQMSIGNPKENTCYMKVAICLEDGTVLYESEILAPGKGVNEITCQEVPEAGEYAAIARFECFRDEQATQMLNGADSAFTLIVNKE